MNLFVPATKAEAKARVAVTGPSGSGKTYTSLTWATVLADGGQIAVVDTERGSAKLYADRFKFDVLTMTPPFHPERLIEAFKAAEAAGYSVVVVDSLSHFWTGPGGVLEIVDEAKARFKGNSHSAWQVGTPLQQRMVDAILGFDGHAIAAMRAKTEWAMEQDDRGRVSPKKIGLAPQQRDMIEYEFTLMLDIDTEHRASVSKTRCELLADRTFSPGEAQESAAMFQAWLRSGDPLMDRNQRDRLTHLIADLSAEQKLALRQRWDAVPLPALATLTTAQAEVAEGLIGDVLRGTVGAREGEPRRDEPDE